ncbi:hypothetical protein J2W92_005074 [Rhizobium leguminosarum]|uniref:hypothetical protein n=1 Tax=Rhizobium leguminosarum TaxID=384 RepID=UPI0024B3C8D7|nr:hypothetical protein [Rhizobium leguminosarum]WHO79825.1 hypothetical protein QMO81_002527 [Rhizobium leguminosarum]
MPKVVLAGSGGLPYPTLKSILSDTADIALFGDSVMERVSRHDRDRRTLGQMVADIASPRSVVILSRSAHNPDIYLPLLQAMAKARRKPRTIVIPINLRCFSPQWEMSPDWTFDQEKRIISRYLRWRWSAIKPVDDVYFDAEKHANFAQEPVEYELSPLSTIGEFKRVIASEPSRERSAAIFTYHYTHRLSQSNLRLKSLRDCVKIAHSIAREVIVYITPINMEALQRFVGPKAADIVFNNIRTIEMALGDEHLSNWIQALPETSFFSEDLATEHLNEVGRQALASLISETLSA